MPRQPKKDSRRNNPNFSPVTAQIPNELGRKLRMFVTQEQLTISEVVEQALVEYLDQKQIQVLSPQPQTIAELVQQNYYKLVTDGKIKPENLQDLASGKKPSSSDYRRIAEILGVDEHQLEAMWRS